MSNENAQITNAHTFTAKIMHWGFIVVFVYALTKQLDEVEELEDFILLQNEMVFAAIFLALLLIRFTYMQFTQPTILPSGSPKFSRRLARTVHLSMYLTLFLIPITGMVIGGLYWSGTKEGSAMDFWLLLHEISINSCYFLIGGHIFAALYHRQKRDGIWNAMAPFSKEPKVE